MAEAKTCTGCGETKPIAEFFWEKRRNRPRARCKTCCSAEIKRHYASNKTYYANYARQWRENNRAKANEASSRSKAKRRREIHAAWLTHQDGKCAICGKSQADPMAMHLDHCHRTGVVRGLLCKGCNYLLAFCDDDEEILAAAIQYLRRHSADPSQPKAHRRSAWWRSMPESWAAGPT